MSGRFIDGHWVDPRPDSRPPSGRSGPGDRVSQARAREDLVIEDYIGRLGPGGAHALGYRRLSSKQEGGTAEVEPVFTPRDAELPHLIPGGPAECSTSTELAVHPDVIWDVNGYYRELGFSFPYRDITRRDIRIAAQERNSEGSVRLTFVLQQLIDRSVRYEYDRAPWGKPFMDGWLEASLLINAKREASRRTLLSGDEVPFEDVLDEWGLSSLSDEEHQEQAEQKKSLGKKSKRGWNWSYYLWRSGHYAPLVLGEWQTLLISEFARQGVRRKFSVGFLGKQPHPWVSVAVGRRLAILLNEAEAPTAELAAKAVAAVLAEHTTDTDK